MKIAIITAMLVIGAASIAMADCYCMCVNNEKQMVCENTWDVPTGFCSGWCSGH